MNSSNKALESLNKLNLEIRTYAMQIAISCDVLFFIFVLYNEEVFIGSSWMVYCYLVLTSIFMILWFLFERGWVSILTLKWGPIPLWFMLVLEVDLPLSVWLHLFIAAVSYSLFGFLAVACLFNWFVYSYWWLFVFLRLWWMSS